MHIAMWSGPRNLSTAMMYSFAARGDFDVLDEPFYGAYLRLTGLEHPMRQEILASMETDPTRVAASLTVSGKNRLYSKQMTQHMVPGIPRGWFRQAEHAFLIRHPARVIASYHAKREKPSLEDIGFVQQAEIFDAARAMGKTPVVVDSHDIRANPERTLRRLCEALGISWTPAMLKWASGGHSADGVWAAHWYGAVHNSTGFADPETDLPTIDPELRPVLDAALPHYEALAAFKV